MLNYMSNLRRPITKHFDVPSSGLDADTNESSPKLCTTRPRHISCRVILLLVFGTFGTTSVLATKVVTASTPVVRNSVLAQTGVGDAMRMMERGERRLKQARDYANWQVYKGLAIIAAYFVIVLVIVSIKANRRKSTAPTAECSREQS